MKQLILLILMTCFFLIQGCSDTPPPAPEPVRPVKTMVAGEHEAGKQWTFAGTAEDALQTDLSFRVHGKIIAFPGEQIGRKFSRGEMIARLDPADYELELREARANLEQIRAGYARAKADVQRIRQLFTRQVMSRSELDRAEAEFNSYAARLSASSKKLDMAQKHLSYTTLEAPFDGWIGTVKTHVHQNVASGQAVVSLSAGAQMKMYVSVPDTLISQIREGGDVAVFFDALPNRTLSGKVMEIGQTSTPGSTYPVKVYLDNVDTTIRSGMSGHVDFLGQTKGGGNLFLPLVAVMGSPGGTHSVWVVDPKTSTVSNRRVSLGILTAYGVEITDGVTAGEIVVIRGVHHLREGLMVRLQKTPVED